MSLPGEIVGDPKASRAMGLLRIWDSPTRAMHWLLVISIAICWWTAENGELDYHQYSGYVALWVVLLRLYWGFVGSSTAKFVNFVRGPKTVFNYARTLHKRDTVPALGHNALGAISVLVLLASVLAVIGTGLFAVDIDVIYSGPLSSYVDFRQGRRLSRLHGGTLFDILLVVIALHLLAVTFYYAWKRQNLVGAMITGKRKGDMDGGEVQVAPVWRLLIGAAFVSVLVWAVTTGFYF
jgi:cytochrome b